MTRMHGPRWGAAPSLLALTALVVACGGTTTHPTPSHSGTATAATTASPSPVATASTSATAAPATPAPTPIAGFEAASVTFVSSQDGWVLGTVGGSLALARTQDGGTTWTSVTPPPTAFYTGSGSTDVSGIRFANQQDGWAYGYDLFATHNGGTTWTQVALPGLSSSTGGSPIQDLETSGGSVDAVITGSSGFDIATSPVGSNSWTSSPTTLAYGAGPVPDAQLVLQGSSGWIVENDRVVGAGARLQSGSWSSWTPPCTTAGGPAVLAPSSATDLFAVCAEGIWAGGPMSVRAYVSTTAGSAFTELSSALPFTSAQVGAYGDSPPPAASPSTSVLAVGDGGDLLASFDSGSTWSTAYSGVAGTSITYVGFTSTTQGVAIEASSASPLGTLLMTRNGGQAWAAVTI
jgi:hypothetical protein